MIRGKLLTQSKLSQSGPLIKLILKLIILIAGACVLIYMSVVTVQNVISNSKLRDRTLFKRAKDLESQPADDEGSPENKGPNYPRIKDWIYNSIFFNFYDGQMVYTNQQTTKGTVARGPVTTEQEMLTEFQTKAAKYLQTRLKVPFKATNCNSVSYRTVPTVGIEASVVCTHPKSSELHRLLLLQPLDEVKVMWHHEKSSLEERRPALNIVMPLKGRPANLKVFLLNLSQALEQVGFTICLTITYFEDEYLEETKILLDEVENSVRNLHVELFVLDSSREFSRGLGLQHGVEKGQSSAEVIFFCDVDMLFTPDYLKRCLATPIRGSQVYAPMIFSLYNPEFVFPLKGQKITPGPSAQMVASDHHGYWRIFGYGMLCMYRSDFIATGGYNKEKVGWGGEDHTIYKQITKRFKVIRTLDPGIFHRYHTKDCGNVPSGQKYSCSRIRATSEASKDSLALWYFKNKDPQTNVFATLAEGSDAYDRKEEEEEIKLAKEEEKDNNVEMSAGFSASMQSMSNHSNDFGPIIFSMVLLAFVLLDMVLVVINYRREHRLRMIQ